MAKIGPNRLNFRIGPLAAKSDDFCRDKLHEEGDASRKYMCILLGTGLKDEQDSHCR